MGIDDYMEERIDPRPRFKQYSLKQKDKEVERIFDELQDRFPTDVRVDFIEVSPELQKSQGVTYHRVDGGRKYVYIRIAEWHYDNSEIYQLRATILHEMAHAYMHNIGYGDINDSDDIFVWLLGRIGAGISGISMTSSEWKDICEPFIEDGSGLKKTDSNDLVVDMEMEDRE